MPIETARIMIAATGSGSGKTTVTCALLAALKKRGKSVVSFKCGPDYIDPTFHRQATEVDCYNIDAYLMGEAAVLESLAFHSKGRDIAVLEGVMGLYDGIGQGSEASSHHVAQVTGTPVLLLVNPKGKGVSVCAEIRGFRDFTDNNIAGVVLNRVNTRMVPYYRDMIEEKTGLKVVGFLPELPGSRLDSRHLGLIPAGEIAGIREMIDCLADAAIAGFDFDLLFNIAAECEKTGVLSGGSRKKRARERVVVYVAHDEAFCFHYADNHRILEDFGAEIRFFSPMRDTAIPDDADGLIFWGGYPELHASALAANETLKESIRKKHAAGLPIYAECGGFMYMNEFLESHAMLGLVEGKVVMTDRLQDFGYVELVAREDNMLCRAGEGIRAHSFHYSRGTNEGNAFTATRAGRDGDYPCIIATDTLFAGYPHLHFACNPDFAENFVAACRRYDSLK